MLRRPPRSTRTDTLFPYTTLFRSCHQFRPADHALGGAVDLSGHPVRCDVLDPVQRDGAVTMAAASASQEREVVIRVRGLVNRYDENIVRSEEHTSELQSLMRISYAVFCLNKKIKKQHHT